MEDPDGIAGSAGIDVNFRSDVCRVGHFHDARFLPSGIQRVVDVCADLHRLLHIRRRHFKTIEMAIYQASRF